jgi:stage V sporulation protein B
MAKVRDVGLYFGGTLLNQGVSFFTGVLVARWLGPAGYGVLSIVRNIYGVAAIFAPLGLDLALLRHFGENKGDWRRSVAELSRFRALVSIVNLAVVGLIALFGAKFLEVHVFHQPDMAVLLVLAFLALPFAGDLGVLTATLRGMERTDLQNIIALWVQPLIRGGLIALVFLLHGGLRGVVLTTAVGAAITDLLMHVVLVRHIRAKDYVGERLAPADRARLLNVMEYSVWLALMLFAYNALRNMDILVLGRFRPPAEVGQYAALSTIAFTIQIFPQALGQTLTPRVARAYASNDFPQMRYELSSYFRRALLLSTPLFVGIAAFGPWLDLLFGPKYHFSPTLSVNLAFAYLVSGCLGPLGSSLTMSGRHRLEFVILIVGSLAALGLCLLLIPRYGANGAALATTVGYLFINTVRAGVSARFMGGLDIRWIDLAIPGVCLAAALALARLLDAILPHSFGSAVAGGLALVIVLALIYPFLLNPEEKGWLAATASRRLPLLKRFGF